MRKPSCILSLLTALAIGLAGCARSVPSEGVLVRGEATLPPAPPPPPPTVQLVFVGDLMLTRTPGKAIEAGADPFAAFGPVLQGADLSIGNLECVIATVGQRVPKAYNFRCDPRTVPLLARYFGAVSVANNHSGDYGKAAFSEQLDLLEHGGVKYFGGGRNFRQAHTALVVERKGIRFAILGYDEIELRSYEAGPETPGVAWSDDEQVVADIAAARAQADFVVVFPHWGLEYHSKPSDRQQTLARKMIDAGADLVVGAHPHVVETAEVYKDRLIVYSLGNFVFDDFVDVPPDLNEPSRTSWVLRVTVSKTGIQSWDTLVARTDDQGLPQPVRGAESPCLKPESKEIALCKAD